jgi:hypothetical protein
MIRRFNNFLLLIFLCVGQLSWAHEAPESLNLRQSWDLFQGDWFDTWEDPKDSRFIEAGIDLKKEFEEATFIREELYKLRQKFAQRFNEMQNLPNANYFQLEKDITNGTIDFTVKYLDKAKPASINKDELAFMGFGSMARGESGIITDLEGSLLWDKNVVGKGRLGYEFGQSLVNLLDGLIGHPIYGIKGYRLDEADHSPFHRAPWARFMSQADAYCMVLKSLPVPGASKSSNKFRKAYYYPFEGSWIYSDSSPEQLAGFTLAGYIEDWPGMWSTKISEKVYDTDWYRWAKQFMSTPYVRTDVIENTLSQSKCVDGMSASQIKKYAIDISHRLQENEVSTLSNFPLLSRNHRFIYGNREMFNRFEAKRNEILNKNNQFLRRKLAFNYLNDLVKYVSAPEAGIVTGVPPETLDLKRFNYRFEEQLYTNLSFLLNLNQQNQGDIINFLVEEGKIGKEYGKKAYDRVNNVIRMRLKKQIALQSQTGRNMLFLTKEAHNKKLQELNDNLAKNEDIANNPESDELTVLEAKNNINEIKANLKLMPKLIPGEADSIITPSDIAYIRDVLFPEQANVLNRLKNFLRDNKDIFGKEYNFDAFKD